MAEDPVFECRRCGHCCEGRGGIVLSAKDIGRLTAFLDMRREDFLARYAEVSNGKLKIIAGDEGSCVFFKPGFGCGIHAARPDICRAWPFFRGNLEDPVSLEMARDYCPGISRDAKFEQFVSCGLAYLKENDLLAKDGRVAANSLVVPTAKADITCD